MSFKEFKIPENFIANPTSNSMGNFDSAEFDIYRDIISLNESIQDIFNDIIKTQYGGIQKNFRGWRRLVYLG